MLGLSLVMLANVHLRFLPHDIDDLLHSAHSVINVLGCATLRTSQWYSHRLLHRMGKGCSHSHSRKDCGRCH